MPRTHIVQDGECLESIAAEYGFPDPDTIYQSGDNEALRARRPDPSIIRPGDEIVIPDQAEREPMTVDKPTGDFHRLDVILPRRKFRIKLAPLDGKPFDGTAFRLVIGGKTTTGAVGGDGLVEGEGPATATSATLTLPEKDMMFELQIGHLDPIIDADTSEPVVSGIQSRLANLGYLGGAITGRMDDATVSALRSFQEKELGREDADGTLDGETLDKLAETHGC